jgi:hypothetical protein
MTRVTAIGRQILLAAVKTVHTVAFAIIATACLLVFWDGLRARPTRRTGVASAIALTECGVYAANGFVCPLTPLAVRLGAVRGSVTDIFLPDRLARNIGWIFGPMLTVGLVLNLRARLRG